MVSQVWTLYSWLSKKAVKNERGGEGRKNNWFTLKIFFRHYIRYYLRKASFRSIFLYKFSAALNISIIKFTPLIIAC